MLGMMGEKRLSERRKNHLKWVEMEWTKLAYGSFLEYPVSTISQRVNEQMRAKLMNIMTAMTTTTTASQWKITTAVMVIIKSWMRHGVYRNVHTHLHSEPLDWMTVRKFIENKQSLMSGELFYYCCCCCCSRSIDCVDVPVLVPVTLFVI